MTSPLGPHLENVGTLVLEVGEPCDLGRTAQGHRRMIPILGGVLSGDLGEGVVVGGGADWQVIHDDGTLSIDAHYAVMLNDGTAVEVRSTGVRAQRADDVYFRTAIFLSAPSHRTDLCGALLVSSGVRAEHQVILDLYRVA
jgi:hypothetical protein